MRFVAGAVWNDIREIARRAQRKWAAVGYASNANGIGFCEGDVLIVDASDERITGGNTSSQIVRQAWKAKAEVYSHKGLHAKVFVLDDTVIVGSANLSANSATLAEAILISTDASLRSEVVAWMTSLKAASQKVDRSFVDRICALPVNRTGFTAGAGRKPSLLEAIRADDERLASELMFRVWSEPATISTRTIQKAAMEKGITALPKDWTYFEDPYSQQYESSLRALRRRVLISFKGAGPEPDGLRKIQTLDAESSGFLGCVRIKDSCVSIFDSEKPTPFRLDGPDAKELCRILNAGIKSQPRFLQRINSAGGWLFDASTMYQLVRAGSSKTPIEKSQANVR